MSRTRWVTKLAVVGLVLWVAAPVGALYLLSWNSSQMEMSPARTVWAPVATADGTIRSDIGLALSWTPSTPAVAPAWEGIVQKVLVQRGAEVTSGSVIANISGVDRIGFASEVPFSRVLSRGDRGTEVGELHRLLRSKDIPCPDGDVFTTETEMAVSKFASSIGVVDARYIRSFDPAWVVYLGQEGSALEVSILVGAPAPSPGSVLFTTTDTLTRAELVKHGVVEAAQQSETFDPRIDIAESARATVDAASTLFVGTTPLVVAETGAEIVVDSLQELSQLVQSGAHAVRARVESPAADGTWLIPSEAVFIGRTGDACVLRMRGEMARAIPISVLSQADGVALVDASLRNTDSVALAPSAPERACG